MDLQTSDIHDFFSFKFQGNNARIKGRHSGIIGQFCENREVEL